MTNNQRPIILKLALRIGYRTGLLTGVSSGLILYIFLDLSDAMLSGLIVALVSGLFSGIITQVLIARRFEHMRSLLQSINSKQFDNYPLENLERKDEIDSLINEAIHSSNTIEREFHRLVRLENYRKDFIGDISHELKTPIFAIQGFIETLLDGALEDEEVNRLFLNKAMKNVNRLTILTKDLMEIAKLETGELKPIVRSIQLNDLLLEVFETLQYKATKENVRLIINDIDKTLKVLADRNQLRQVLQNLIENGIKYNSNGGTVTVGVYPYAKKDTKVWVYIKDTGIGISQSDISRVTERFFRVDKSRSRDKGGTGLGLAIVKHILESHGDQLRVTSQLGKGSVFSFSLQNSDRISG